MPDRPEIPDCAAVAEAIGLPVDAWPGRCHEVACAVLDAGLVAGVERYGHYYGPVAPGGMFNPDRPLQRHGWIERPDGSVVDPTRWVFEAAAPYIYAGPGDDYDAGGRRLALFRRRALPYPEPGDDRPCPLVLDAETRAALGIASGGRMAPGGPETIGQVLWLANCPPEWFDGRAAEFYRALEAAGQRALVPIDFWRQVTRTPLAGVEHTGGD